MAKISGKSIILSFYEEEPPSLSAPPEMYKKFMPLLVWLHFIGLIMNYVIFIVKTLKVYRCNCIVIEDEGFIHKQLADLLYISKFASVSLSSKYLAFFLKFSMRLLIKIKHKRVVIFRITNYGELRRRYVMQRRREPTMRRRIEPWDYVAFQQAVYAGLGGDCLIHADRDPYSVLVEVVRCLM
ncbi:MAG: hypothetical protein ABWK01_05935 [Infirmifilum sp.]